MRIAIVNDLQTATEALRRLVASVPDCRLAWTAVDGAEAVAHCRRDRPDLVLMDLIMPVMDGVEATRRIMRESPCPILVVTATVEGNLDRVYNALGAGALDAVNCPTFGTNGSLVGGEPVKRKIEILRLLHGATPRAEEAERDAPSAPEAAGARLPLVVVGASTGGPDAVSTVLLGISPGFAAAIVVVQHLDRQFVPGFVDWLSRATSRRVRAIAAGDRPEEGVVQIACTDDHLVLGPGSVFTYRAEPLSTPYRPSVDVFFQSVAAGGVAPGVAVVLTGMGSDGADGLLRLRQRGWTTIAQDESTSVVYGMPRAAKDAGAAEQVLALPRIGAAVESAWSVRARPVARGGR